MEAQIKRIESQGKDVQSTCNAVDQDAAITSACPSPKQCITFKVLILSIFAVNAANKILCRGSRNYRPLNSRVSKEACFTAQLQIKPKGCWLPHIFE